jgi:23S rRNA pseudouridine1911/1915/1917 synthase
MHRVVVPQDQTLLAALVESGLTKKTARARLAAGAVTVNGATQTSGGARVASGDVVELGQPRPTLGLGLELIFQDDDVIAVSKPAGLLSVPGGGEKERTAEAAIREFIGQRPWRVHRLDRETSGVLLYAKHKEAALTLERNWRAYEKRYLAVTSPPPTPASGTIDAPLRETRALDVVVDETRRGTRDAITHYKTLAVVSGRALVEVNLETGRKHQIRVHLAHLGAPVLGDKRYGGARHGRLALHARSLRFWLKQGQWREALAAPPKGFAPTALSGAVRANS